MDQFESGSFKGSSRSVASQLGSSVEQTNQSLADIAVATDEEHGYYDDDLDLSDMPAPDGGWGWMTVLGCMLMHLFLGGFSRCYGIVYVEIREVFNASATVGAWVGGLGTAIRMVGSPLATALSNRFSARKVVCTGGLILGLCPIVSAFTPNAEFLFFSYSLLLGVGGTLCYAPTIVVVGQYFNERRSLAMGIACAGSGLGTFIYPPVVERMFDQYGYVGCMLILGAYEFHMCVSGLLCRPIEVQKRMMWLEYRQKKQNRTYRVVKQHQCVHSKQTDRGTTMSPKEKNSTETTPVKKNFTTKSKLLKYLDWRLLRNPSFLCYIFSMAFMTTAYISAQMLVADLAISRGATVAQGAFLLSMLGIMDMFGRLASGVMFDLPFIRPVRRHFYNALQAVSAITMYLLAFVYTYSALMVICVAHGLFTGAMISQRATIVVDILGAEHLSSAFGLTVFAQGVGLLAGPAFAGYLKDSTEQYTATYIFTAACATLAAALLVSDYLYQRYRRSKIKAEPGAAAEEVEL